jgi:hypothetical protein
MRGRVQSAKTAIRPETMTCARQLIYNARLVLRGLVIDPISTANR